MWSQIGMWVVPRGLCEKQHGLRHRRSHGYGKDRHRTGEFTQSSAEYGRSRGVHDHAERGRRNLQLYGTDGRRHGFDELVTMAPPGVSDHLTDGDAAVPTLGSAVFLCVVPFHRRHRPGMAWSPPFPGAVPARQHGRGPPGGHAAVAGDAAGRAGQADRPRPTARRPGDPAPPSPASSTRCSARRPCSTSPSGG
jgi:hypothetical protein